MRTISSSESAFLVFEFLRMLSTNGTSSRQGSANLVEQAITIIGARWNDPPSVSQLASTLGISREHFIRVFHQQTGTTPGAWIRRFRLQQVATMLTSEDQTLTAVATEARFSTAGHLTRAFRNEFGESPSAAAIFHHRLMTRLAPSRRPDHQPQIAAGLPSRSERS